MSQSCFLIISNMRCGSTLTQFMLGELADASTDFEIKWKPAYTPQAIHLVIDEHCHSIKERLQDFLKPKAIIGSKLVFDPVYLSAQEYRTMLSMIDADIRIIHIKRPYWEILASSLRGFIHLPTQQRDASDSSAYEFLRDARLDAEKKSSQMIHRKNLNIFSLYRQLKILFNNDMWARKLAQSHAYYLVSYKNLTVSLPALAQHIGSYDTAEHIQYIATHPPLEKLPPIRYEGKFWDVRLMAMLMDGCFWLWVKMCQSCSFCNKSSLLAGK